MARFMHLLFKIIKALIIFCLPLFSSLEKILLFKELNEIIASFQPVTKIEAKSSSRQSFLDRLCCYPWELKSFVLKEYTSV